MNELFLGMDIGGTKTHAVLVDSECRIVYEHFGKGASYQAMPIEIIGKNLCSVIRNVKKHAKGKIKSACFGFAGVNSEIDRKRIGLFVNRGKIRRALGCRIRILNDVEIILPSINEKSGVAVIGGTGCNFYAKNGSKEAYASGLNYLLTDEGSGFDMGLKVLRAAIRSYDLRGGKTLLEKLVKEKTGLEDMRQIGKIIYAKGFQKTRVANFAPLAERAADKGDMAAMEILLSAAGEYLTGIKAVARRTGIIGKKFTIAVVGSAISSKYILPELKRLIRKSIPKASIVMAENPALGAARLAISSHQ